MKPLKDLEIVYSPWDQFHWPTDEMLDHRHAAYYSEATHCLYLETQAANSEFQKVNCKNKFSEFAKENPDHTEGIPPEIEKALREHRKKMDASGEKSKRRRKFIKAVTRGVKFDDALTAMNFLNGATEGGGNLKIRGDSLRYYADILIHRIGPKEFLLGRNLSGGGTNNASCEARIIPAIFQSPAKFWPSDLHYKSDLMNMGHPSYYVFFWVLHRLQTIQIKYPTAAKHRLNYEALFHQTVETLNQARSRWQTDFTTKYFSNVQQMIDIFGDVPKMKEYNAGLRMRYEMTGEV